MKKAIWFILGTLVVALAFKGWVANAEILPPNDSFNDTSCTIEYDDDQYAAQEFTFDQNYYLDDFYFWVSEKIDDEELADLGIIFREKNGDDLVVQYVSQFEISETLDRYNLPLNVQIDSSKTYQFIFAATGSSISNNYYIGTSAVEGLGDSGCWTAFTNDDDLNLAMELNGHLLSTGSKNWFIKQARAEECTFVTNGATTTASCTPTIINDPVSGAFYQYLLFYISLIFIFVLWNKLKRKGGD